MASSNEATPIVSTNSRPPTLTQLLGDCAPSSWFLPPPHHDRACHSTASRVQADAGTTAYDCVARLGGLNWGSPASPGVRVLSSFFDVLEQHPSLLDLFREELDAISNAPYSEMGRKSEHDVEISFHRLLFGGLESATAALLNHYAAITEGVGASSASASTSATRPRYSVRLGEPESALRTQGDAVVYIQRGVGNIVSSILIEYKRDDVHHSLAKVRQEGALSHIPILDHGAPVPLQKLEEEKSKGADAVATKAIIQCVSSDSRFFLLLSVPFFQIGELVQHQSTHAATASDPVASTSAASASNSAATAYSPAPPLKARYSLILQELARWVEPSPTTLSPAAAETLGTDLPRRSLIVSFIALAFTAVIEVPKPDQAVIDKLLDARRQPPNRPRARSNPDSDPNYEPSSRVQKAQKTSAEATGARSSARLAGQPPRAQTKDSNQPITPPISVGLQSDPLSDPLTPVTRIFSSPPASTDWSPATSPLSGSRLPSKSITIVEDREFVIKASLSNAHWSMMSYTGTSRVELVEIDFDIVSSVPSDSPLVSRLPSKPSPASDFIRGLHLSDVVLRWLSENPREELEDDRIPLQLLDRFEPAADLRLEKEVGTGSTAGGWLAHVVRVNRPLCSSAKPEVPLVDHPAPNTTYFLKLVPCSYVGSVIRETLFYQHVFPYLPDHLRKHLPQFYGTYRRTNGNGYAMVLENVGKTMNELDFDGSPGELWCREIEAAFRELGIIHNDVSAGNVLVRPNNGPVCFVDWGRSYLKLRV
ncbi:BZ3500_MvSof-1268-A1-R1_Chr8-1g09722 [Microbotryum saponariae]|uniref:BZ3500_MvSof-1268-A1-R1_Chr8-1g09722 protein n=1 Tax=Microbotryum saponariae TaxID=289078 RepID=A0A2X0KRX2_9BASI|nr:BZ3500_MvSof-1268-A1-R1_Chr8-1g09722 [Microbotryum saponariae]SDA08008.1 BZ3501_MvSof-1269-A2-R1_Chr8-1g09445 [Microbotryum saponariae]